MLLLFVIALSNNKIKAQSSEVFLGEVIYVAFDRVPNGFLPCDGRQLSIKDNEALFSLLGTQFGGNGQTTFAIPDLRDRVLLGSGMNMLNGISYLMGESGGSATHSLTLREMPTHSHAVKASPAKGNSHAPENNFLADTQLLDKQYVSQANVFGNRTLDPASVSTTGGSQPHNNMQKYIALKCLIAIQGIYPNFN